MVSAIFLHSMQPPVRFTAKLVDRIDHSSKFIQLFFEYTQPATLSFSAGQYVSLQVSPHGDRRSYSICSSPDKTHGFELLIDLSPQGLGTTYLSQLKIGEEVQGLGPMGVFFITGTVETEPELCLIATGSGVTPFRAIVSDLLQVKQDQRPITLLWGMRHAEELFWVEELQQLSQAFPNFMLHLTVSQPPPEWSLCQGRVTDCLKTHAFSGTAGFYLCGNAGMITDVMGFLAEQGVPKERVHHEKFF